MKEDKKKAEKSKKNNKSPSIYQELKGWKDIELGGIIKAKDSECQLTGSWRSFRPVHIPEKCINCMLCWTVCPDAAIKGKDGNFKEIDYDYCKGCGLCAKICPTKAIEMKPETDFNK